MLSHSPGEPDPRPRARSALRLLGEVSAHHDPPKRADATAKLSRSPRSPACVPSSRTAHLGLGKLYAPTDKREQAHEHLTTATTMFRRMDMRFWLEKEEAEIRELA
jgi:hypothetical protein